MFILCTTVRYSGTGLAAEAAAGSGYMPARDSSGAAGDAEVEVSAPNSRFGLLGTWVGVSVVNRLLHSPLCNVMFGCGCAPLWAGGWRHCNVHRVPDEARCPWCTMWLRKDAAGWVYKGGPLDSAIDQDGLTVLAMTAAFWYSLGALERKHQLERPRLNRTEDQAYHALRAGINAEGHTKAGFCRPPRFFLAVLLPSIMVSLCAGFCSIAVVGLVWGRVSNYPYFFGIGDVAAIRWDSSNATGNDSSGASLMGSIAIGTVGGMFWSGTILSGILWFRAVSV